MTIRYALLAFLAASCAAPASIPTPPPGEGSKASHPDPADAGPAKKDAPKKAVPKNETLGQCLARKGMHLYGAAWCHPCHQQLEWFGEDAKNVPYTDCQPDGLANVPACEALGLEIFPTWIFHDGLRVEGTRSLKWLAVSTDCPLRIK